MRCSTKKKDTVNIKERYGSFSEDCCYQHHISNQNREEVLKEFNLTENQVNEISLADLECKFVDRKDKDAIADAREFIEKHEWLGKVHQRSTHYFAAYYKEKLVGVVIMATPNAFCSILGEGTLGLEKLIGRGVSNAIAPKNLGSKLLSFAVDWMVKNTPFRVFSAYSDTQANELGTIYQSLNAIYAGKTSGGNMRCFDSQRPEKGWFSDREIRKRGAYRRYAKELGITWEKEWNTKWTIHWDKMPFGVEEKLRQASRDYFGTLTIEKTVKKHKYYIIKGRTKKETKELEKRFLEKNPKLDYRLSCGRLIGKEYPKKRGE